VNPVYFFLLYGYFYLFLFNCYSLDANREDRGLRAGRRQVRAGPCAAAGAPVSPRSCSFGCPPVARDPAWSLDSGGVASLCARCVLGAKSTDLRSGPRWSSWFILCLTRSFLFLFEPRLLYIYKCLLGSWFVFFVVTLVLYLSVTGYFIIDILVTLPFFVYTFFFYIYICGCNVIM